MNVHVSIDMEGIAGTAHLLPHTPERSVDQGECDWSGEHPLSPTGSHPPSLVRT